MTPVVVAARASVAARKIVRQLLCCAVKPTVVRLEPDGRRGVTRGLDAGPPRLLQAAFFAGAPAPPATISGRRPAPRVRLGARPPRFVAPQLDVAPLASGQRESATSPRSPAAASVPRAPPVFS
jgi:hypothetical protein